jgi:outer membrane protein assembly factor BamB
MIRRRRWTWPWLLVLAIGAPSFFAFHRARANSGTVNAQWKVAIGTRAFGAATNFPVGATNVAFLVPGGQLYAFNADTGAFFWNATGSNCNCGGGVVAQCCQAFGGGLVDHVPAAVTLSDNSGTFLFVANEDGNLYKVNATNGQIAGTANLKRPGCATDHLKAAPTIQLAQFSSANFNRIYGGHDIVFVPTAYDSGGACATTTNNRIFAIDANTMGIAWNTGAASLASFNNPYLQALDEADEGCELDDQNDIIYCAFRQPGGSQKSLVALRTHNAGGATENKYGIVWSAPYTTGVNAGDIQVRPFLRGGKIYIANNLANLAAYNAASGAQIWSVNLNCATCNIQNNTWLEFRNGYTSTALTLTADGRLHSVTDETCAGLPCGVESWCRGCFDTGGFNTEPAVDPFLSKIYIGKDDGRLHQLNLTTGSEDGYIGVDSGTTGVAMGDPSLDSSTGASIDRLTIGSVSGTVARICPPFPVGTMTATPPPPAPPPPTPPPTDNGLQTLPPLLPVCNNSINNCGCDQDCACYSESLFTAGLLGAACMASCDQQGTPCISNRYGANPTCNAFKCDIPTHTCYATKQRDGAACNNGNTCELNQQCLDGICRGTPNPACGLTGPTGQCDIANTTSVGIGKECNFQGVEGQCCMSAAGAPACTATSSSTTNCGSCAGDSCVAPVPDCINGTCCNACGTGRCIDLSSDNANCGACNTQCSVPTGDQCVSGLCEPSYVVATNNAAFIDACTMGGTVLTFTPNNNDGIVTGSLGVGFTFYKQIADTIHIGTDGNVYFGVVPAVLQQNVCPRADSVHGFIAPFWDNLDLTCVGAPTPSKACIFQDRVNLKSIITWENAQFSPCNDATPNGRVNVTLVLNNNNTTGNHTIEMYYGTLQDPAGQTGRSSGRLAVVGMEDFQAVQSTKFECRTINTITAGLHITFTPQ